MDNVKSDTINLEKISWFHRRCRDLVFSQLLKLEGARLTIDDFDKSWHFGDADADLSATMVVHNPETYARIVKGGSIGASEAFIDELWDSPDLTKLIQVFARFQDIVDKLEAKQTLSSKLKNWIIHRNNRNSLSQAKKNIGAHYDLGNELYSRFLDKEMVYSSAIYDNDDATLEEAQLSKFKHICDRLELKPGEQVLEIGTGWGGLAIYAAQNYDVHVTTTTISEQQFEYAQARVEQLGLADKITLLKQDYRKLTGEYDKVVSIEMIEAVGKEYFSTYFQTINERLKPHGKLLIQAITIADQRYEEYSKGVDFIQKYIFPGGCLPSVNVMVNHLTKETSLVTEGLVDIGLDYAKTLREWRSRFIQNWNEIKTFGYDNTFKRLWLYYLCYCEGAFWERRVSTVHLIARKL